MVSQQPSVAEQLVATIVAFPKYIVGWILGLIIECLRDLSLTTFAVTGILAGFVFHSVLVGLFVFFVVYSAARTISNLADALGVGLNRHADATYQGLTYQTPVQVTVSEAPPEVN